MKWTYKRWICMLKRILFSCLFTLLILFGCQTDKTDTTETSDDETTTASSKNEEKNETELVQGTLPDEHLQKLDEGTPVKQLQQALMQLGYPLEETGSYDEMTTWAITDLQLSQDSTYINGVYNQDTKAMIQKEKKNETELVQGTLPDEHLQKLDEGTPVKQLQQALMQLGYPLEETGSYDEMTTWAITDLQLSQDSTYINGVYNQDTKAMIQ